MKAIITIYDDNDCVIEKDRALDPVYTETRVLSSGKIIKNTYFSYKTSEVKMKEGVEINDICKV